MPGMIRQSDWNIVWPERANEDNMTEAEWLASDDPQAMLRLVTGEAEGPHAGGVISDRKLRLFACACCRQVWHLLVDDAPCGRCGGHGYRIKDKHGHDYEIRCRDCNGTGRVNRSRRAVLVAERFADGEATADELAAARAASWDTVQATSAAPWDAAWVAAWGGTRAAQAALLREVVGDPFRPVKWGTRKHFPWLYDPQVVSLATAAYEERPGDDGALDPVRLMVLADALEEVGYTEEAMLRHLRGQRRHQIRTSDGVLRETWLDDSGPHVRGCWALDLILGKE